MACRNMDKGHQAAAQIVLESGNHEVYVYHLDLASMESIRKFAQHVKESK